MDTFCIALFFISNELTAFYKFTQHLIMMMMMYTCIAQSVTPCSTLSTFGSRNKL